jgi:hypothetical protein
MHGSAVLVARELLLAGAAGFKELLMYTFPDDEAAHQDDLQKRVRREFTAAFDATVTELTTEFGQPSRSGDRNDGLIPLGGVFRFAVWAAGGRELYAAAAHEDRELPYLLVLGTV